jgi:hypothetical protein
MYSNSLTTGGSSAAARNVQDAQKSPDRPDAPVMLLTER